MRDKLKSPFDSRRYRMYYAAPFFMVDLEYEIKWHSKYLKKLKHYKRNPKKFHRDHLTAHSGKHPVKEIFKEQVLESIPFHEKALDEHKARLKLIKSMMSLRRYRQLRKFCMKHSGMPEYFIFDKKEKKIIFATDRADYHKKRWISLAKRKKLAETIIMRR